MLTPPVDLEDHSAVVGYMKQVADVIGGATPFQKKAKKTLLEWVGQQLCHPCDGVFYSIMGPDPVAREELARNGIAKIYERKFEKLDLTEFKTCDQLLQACAQASRKTEGLNPLIYMENWDPRASLEREVLGAFCYLLDPTVNREIFLRKPGCVGETHDLSKVLVVLSGRSGLDDIFEDRSWMLRTRAPSLKKKVEYLRTQLLPELAPRVDRVAEETLRDIICCYTREPGVTELTEVAKKLAAATSPEQRTWDKKFVRSCLGASLYTRHRCDRSAKIGSTWIVTLDDVSEMPTLQRLSAELVGSKVEEFVPRPVQEAIWDASQVVKDEWGRKGIRGVKTHRPERAENSLALFVATVSRIHGLAVRQDTVVMGEFRWGGFRDYWAAFEVSDPVSLKNQLRLAREAGARRVVLPSTAEWQLERIRNKHPELLEGGLSIIKVDSKEELLSQVLVAGGVK